MGNVTTDVPILLLLNFSAVKLPKRCIYSVQTFLWDSGISGSYFSNNVQETTIETSKSKLQVLGNARIKF